MHIADAVKQKVGSGSGYYVGYKRSFGDTTAGRHVFLYSANNRPEWSKGGLLGQY